MFVTTQPDPAQVRASQGRLRCRAVAPSLVEPDEKTAALIDAALASATIDLPIPTTP